MRLKIVPSGVIGHLHWAQLRRVVFALMATIGGVTITSSAHAAAACDAPWMHQGGGFDLTSSPGNMVTRFLVTRFAKGNAENCQIGVRVTATMTMAGHTMSSESDFNLTIASGKAHTEQMAGGGSLKSQSGPGTMTGVGTTQATGLLSYIGEITHEGQRLPGTHNEVSISTQMSGMGQTMQWMSAPKLVSTTTEKLVGKQEQLATAIGRFQCWPISYDRQQNGAPMTFLGRTTRAPDRTAHIVDHFCPATGLVMRMDIDAEGSQSVTALH